MAGSLNGRRVVLGVTGGIAAYKAADLVSRLKKEGAAVRVVMTENACRFVGSATFEALSGGPVYTKVFHDSYQIGHVSLARECDLLVIAPATANILAKMAGGIGDDILSTTCLAVTSPVLAAPAMNGNMWKHPATQANIKTLEDRGVRFVGPAQGILACGDVDVGRMAEPQHILEAIKDILCPRQDLAGRHIMVTAGPSREMVDPVRFLSNRSSGKMGYAIARAAAQRGARVTLLTGPVNLPAPQGVEVVPFTSTQQLYQQAVSRFEGCDGVIQAAAPADFTPESYSEEKIKKTGNEMVLRLTPTPDVAKALGERKKEGQVLVAFAAESGDLVENAQKKLLKKNADLVVANDITRTDAGFGVDTNQVIFITAQGQEHTGLLTKEQVAHRILDKVAALWNK